MPKDTTAADLKRVITDHPLIWAGVKMADYGNMTLKQLDAWTKRAKAAFLVPPKKKNSV